jgi:methylmalonyl-CoA mutase N-terminal domain/subunit
VVVGVNKYRPLEDHPVETLDVDNARVRESAGQAPAEIKAKRDARRSRPLWTR